MPTIIAIGGGELRSGETLPIDRMVVAQTGKKHPRALFIPTASNDSERYWHDFSAIYGKKLGCTTDVLLLTRGIHSKKDIQTKIAEADVIYVGGGNTLKMLKVWRSLGVDILLKKAYQRGTVLAGLSAGAICWFRYGVSDARRFMKGGIEDAPLMRVRGLGLLPYTVSPHHVREKKRRDDGLAEIMQRTPGIGIAIDDGAALVISDDTYRIVSAHPGRGVRVMAVRMGRSNWSVPVHTDSVLKLLSLAQ